MKNISISEEVWQALIRRGRSGETVDEILRRILGIHQASEEKPPSKQPTSSRSMMAKVIGDNLLVVFSGGISKAWHMPPRRDRTAIDKVLRSATRFAGKHGASSSHVKRIEKALADAGYYSTRQGRHL